MTAATTEDIPKESFRLDAQAIMGLSVLIVVLSVVLTLATVYVARYLNSPGMRGMKPPAEQSYAALTYVRGHVEGYWKQNGIMPQYIPLAQLGVEPGFVQDLPAIQFVRIGGAPADQQSTYIEAAIKQGIQHPTAGHSVIMTVDSMPEPSITGRQTYYRCYVRGPNGSMPVIDMKNFPGVCRNTDPLGGMGVKGSEDGRSLKWPLLK